VPLTPSGIADRLQDLRVVLAAAGGELELLESLPVIAPPPVVVIPQRQVTLAQGRLKLQRLVGELPGLRQALFGEINPVLVQG